MSQSTGYTIGFAAAVCLVCSVFVSSAAVALKDRQEQNKVLDRQKKVLTVAGLMEEGESLSAEEIQSRFDKSIQARLVDIKKGEEAADGDANAPDVSTYDQRKAAKDPALSYEIEANDAKVARLPNYATVYHVKGESGDVEQVILPIRGPGLWSTLYGYISLESDGNTIQGITFYEHAETPGLGGEVDNPKWKAGWKGRKAYKGDEVGIKVIKGKAGTPSDDPYSVDGLSGATITSNGVTKTLDFWLGEQGFGPYLDNFQSGGA